MPLTMANVGQIGRITTIQGKDETRLHLERLGFISGELVTVVSKLGGNFILSIKDSRVALDRSMANRIIVQCA